MPSVAIYLSPSTTLLEKEALNSDILETELVLGTICEQNVNTNVKLPGTHRFCSPCLNQGVFTEGKPTLTKYDNFCLPPRKGAHGDMFIVLFHMKWLE